MKRKLAVAPFTKETYPLIACPPPEFEICAAIAPHGIGIDGSDLSVLRNREPIGFRGTADLEGGIAACDAVLIPDLGDLSRGDAGPVQCATESLSAFALRALDEAVRQKKDVLCLSTLDREGRERCARACERNGRAFSYGERAVAAGKQAKYRHLSAPVIFVGETGPDCDGYEVFLQLLRSLRADNKRVLALSEDKANVLYGQRAVSFWTIDDPLSSAFNLNAYVAELAEQTRPDVVLVRLPLPMMKFDDEITFDFGLSAFMISQALPADFLLYCSYYSLRDPQLMAGLSENFFAKFGFPISAIHLSNQMTDFSVDNKESMQTAFIPDPDDAAALRRESQLPYYNLHDGEEYSAFYRALCEELFNLSYGVIAL